MRSPYSMAAAFPVGYARTEITGHVTYPTTIYYPALEQGADAQPDKRHKPYPAIIFAKGFVGMQLTSHPIYTGLCQHIASHGYVVATCESATANPLRALRETEEAITESIDYMTSTSSFIPVQDIVAEDNIGAAGHSLGAMTVLGAATQDHRITAVVSMAPFYNYSIWKIGKRLLPNYLEACRRIRAPTQIICGHMDFLCQPTKAIAYYQALTVTKEFVVINGASHDLGIMDSMYGRTQKSFVGNLTSQYLINWFDYFLRGARDACKRLFGTDANKDLANRLLTVLDYELKQ